MPLSVSWPHFGLGGHSMLRIAAPQQRHLPALSCFRCWHGRPSIIRAVCSASQICQTGQPQHTISSPIKRIGVGLHTGERATIKLLPASADEGRYFVNLHNEADRGDAIVLAHLKNVSKTTLGTCLGRGQGAIQTVEHLLSALEGLGVDNCRIEIEGGNEVPLLDGSAREWVEAIEESGISIAADVTGAQVGRDALVVDRPITVNHGDSFVAAFPAPTTRLSYGIDFPHIPAIGTQWFTWTPTDAASYKREVAPARTFGIYEQIEQLRAAGLIKGGSIDNALVCSGTKGWLNPPLRFADEPCRHKLLDLIGDLALCATPGHAGLPIAHIVAFKASHSLHVKFGEALLQYRHMHV